MNNNAVKQWRLMGYSQEKAEWLADAIGWSGDVIIIDEDIEELIAKFEEAKAASERPYDHIWDMYYDEFDDAEVGDDFMCSN